MVHRMTEVSGAKADHDTDRDLGSRAPLRAWLYDATGSDCEIAPRRIHPKRLQRNQLLWVDIQGLAAPVVKLVEMRFGIAESVFGRLARNDRKLLLDNYGRYFTLTVLTAPGTAQEPQRLVLIVGPNWLISISAHAPPDFITQFRKQDKGETKIGLLSSAELLAALLDWHLAAFFVQVSDIEQRVDQLDEMILRERGQAHILQEMVAIRRAISELRRMLADQRPVFYALARPDITALLPEGAVDAFEHLGTRLERAIDEVERTRDVLVGSFDLFTSLSAQTTNELVKALTFATVVIGVFAAVAGLLGMNFEMAFFKTGTRGFVSVVVGLLVLSGASLVIAKRRGWI